MAVGHGGKVAAVQVLYEATNLPDEIVAAAVDWRVRYLAQTARRLGWRKAPASRGELARRTRRLVERRLDAIDQRLASAEQLSAAAEKTLADEALKIHNTLNIARLAADNEEDSARERTGTDEQLTEILRRIDQRIADLAEQHARELVAGRHSGRAGAGGAGELADAGDGAPAGADPSA